MRLIQLYQNETEQGLFDTYKVVLPDGTEFVKTCDDELMNVDFLDPYVGERAVLHVYNGKEHIVSEEVTLGANVDSPFGGRVPSYHYDEEEVGPSDEVEELLEARDSESEDKGNPLIVNLQGLFDDEDEPDENGCME